MNLHELEQALSESIRLGDVGIPVALRVTCQFGDRSINVVDGALVASRLAETAFSENKPSRLHARATSDNRQLTLLASYPLGQTFFLTTTAIDGACSALDLLLIGNHGIIRLEGGELFAPESSDASNSEVARWKMAIEQSLHEQSAVDLAS